MLRIAYLKSLCCLFQNRYHHPCLTILVKEKIYSYSFFKLAFSIIILLLLNRRSLLKKQLENCQIGGVDIRSDHAAWITHYIRLVFKQCWGEFASSAQHWFILSPILCYPGIFTAGNAKSVTKTDLMKSSRKTVLNFFYSSMIVQFVLHPCMHYKIL